MSSRVLAENKEDRARPFAWRTVAPADSGRGAPEVPTADFGVGQSHPVESRREELEQALEGRAREAREAGFREGEAASKAAAMEEVRAVIERLAEAIAGFDEHRSRLYRQAEVDAVRLSIAIARRVLRRELTVDPGAIQGLVTAALEKLQSQEPCRVRMHPDHVPAMRVAIDRLGMSAKAEILPDPTQEPGAAIFEMTRGNLDASMDSQLREIERGLVDRFQRPW